MDKSRNGGNVIANCDVFLGYDFVRVVEKPLWLPDTINVEFMGREGYLIIEDCKGNARLFLFDENGNELLAGRFKESNIYKKRRISSDSNKVNVSIPIIDGTWYFNRFTATNPYCPPRYPPLPQE